MGFESSGMSLYTLDEFFARLMDDLEWEDLPLPCTNQQLMDHFERSVLKPFSQFAPRQEKIRFGEEARVQLPPNSASFRRYRLPMYMYPGATCFGVACVEPVSNLGYSDEFGGIPFMGMPDQMLMAMADIRMYSSLGAASNRSLTTDFKKPDILDLYGGCYGTAYEAIMLLSHDLSLSTVPDSAFEDLYELALLDTQAYFYSKLMRKEGLDTGVGQIQLKIDQWSNAKEERKALLQKWRDEGYNIDINSLQFFS